MELWIGLSFLIILLAYIPVVGSSISGMLNTIVSMMAQIPFYSIIIAIFGTVLFFDGLIRLF